MFNYQKEAMIVLLTKHSYLDQIMNSQHEFENVSILSNSNPLCLLFSQATLTLTLKGPLSTKVSYHGLYEYMIHYSCKYRPSHQQPLMIDS